MLGKEALTYLKQLKIESIQILKGVDTEFSHLITIYPIGKDLSVIFHLLMKVFSPAELPFPLLHNYKIYNIPLQYDNQ